MTAGNSNYEELIDMKENADGSWKIKTDTLMSWWEVQQDCGPFGILEHTREILKYLFG